MRDRPWMNIQRQPKPRIVSPTRSLHPLHTNTRVRVPRPYSSSNHTKNNASSPMNGPSSIGITAFTTKVHSLGLQARCRLAPAGSVTARVGPRTSARAPRPCARGTRRAARAWSLPAARAAPSRLHLGRAAARPGDEHPVGGRGGLRDGDGGTPVCLAAAALLNGSMGL